MKKRNSRKLVQAVSLPLAAFVVLILSTSIESSAQSQLACELTKMNVVYVGVDNPLIIAASDYSVNDLEIEISNGQINGLAGKYVVRPAKAGNVELTIKADGKVLGTRSLRALLTPDPRAVIVLKLEGEKKFMSKAKLTINQLAEINKIHAKIDDFLFDIDFQVSQFEIKALGNGGISVVEKSSSNKLTDQQKHLLKSLRSGQKIFIENIKAIGPDGLVRDLNDIVIKVL